MSAVARASRRRLGKFMEDKENLVASEIVEEEREGKVRGSAVFLVMMTIYMAFISL
jgi:hypothetical protein